MIYCVVVIAYTPIMNSCLQLYSMIHRPHLKLGAEASVLVLEIEKRVA